VITIVCDWGGDLSIGPSGDIGVSQVQTNVQQRVIRRLLTNPGDYIWHIDYGAGLGSYVGEPYSPTFIEGTILNQLQHEALVATTPAPTIETDQLGPSSSSASSIKVQYQVAGTAVSQSVFFGLGE
jgi:hypothetical protein